MVKNINPDWDRIDAIRRMLNAPEGEQIALPSGEIVRSWYLLDERGDEVGISEISLDAEILRVRVASVAG